MHSSRPFSISLAIITLLTAATLTTAQSTTKPATLKLTTVAAYPSTWTVSANCFSEISAQDDNQEIIYNMGCGAQVRKSCCPPGWNPAVVFGGATSTVGGTRGVCPSGYIDRPEWGGATDGPVLTKAGGERTVVCCPSGISLWSLFGLSQTALCYTQNPSSRANSRLSDPYFVSTYARPFFLAVEAVVTATSASNTGTTSNTPSRSTSTGLGTTSTSSGGSVPTETGGGVGDGGDTDPGGDDGQAKKSGLSSGAIAGIVIGVIAPTALGILAFIFWRRKRSNMMDGGIDPPVPPPAQDNADKYIPFDDSRSSSYGKVETGAYRYKLPAGSETILSSNTTGMRNGENHEERRVAVFENAEKLPDPGTRENEAVYAQQNYKFGGPARVTR
ncbi:hypothetical protein TWF481_010193 [Arthrobotrys musiformis]|uniref:Mid2 domain-containing protein n=1 Tax=Arthrobotrys musiformis TaxID=47236 RepID=A0AAV9W247_9PEZI